MRAKSGFIFDRLIVLLTIFGFVIPAFADAKNLLMTQWRNHQISVELQSENTPQETLYIRYTNFSEAVYSRSLYYINYANPAFKNDIYELYWRVDESGNSTDDQKLSWIDPGVAALIEEPVIWFFKKNKTRLMLKNRMKTHPLTGIIQDENGENPRMQGGNNWRVPKVDLLKTLQYFEHQSPPSQASVNLNGDTLLVVHSDGYYDNSRSTETAVKKIQTEFKNNQKNIIHLYEENYPSATWMANAVQPTLSYNDYTKLSGFTAGTVTMVGGFFGACFAHAFEHMVAYHFSSTQKKLSVIFRLDSIYTGTPSSSVKDTLSNEEIIKFIQTYFYAPVSDVFKKFMSNHSLLVRVSRDGQLISQFGSPESPIVEIEIK